MVVPSGETVPWWQSAGAKVSVCTSSREFASTMDSVPLRYHQYCPVARASEIFADRWTPLLVRELLAGSRHFNEIRRGLPGISRSLLVSRLRQLEDGGVVQRHAGARSNATEYVLTDAGRDLKCVIEVLGPLALENASAHHRQLVLKREEVSLCLRPPGFDPCLTVRADVATLHRVWVVPLPHDSVRRTSLSSWNSAAKIQSS
jgi:DNA-binding HxlR family transcriptional regulator